MYLVKSEFQSIDSTKPYIKDAFQTRGATASVENYRTSISKVDSDYNAKPYIAT